MTRLSSLSSRLAALACALALTGCNQTPPGAQRVSKEGGWDRQIWTDPETGCQYHFWQSGLGNTYAMALAPRIGSDGRPMCSPAREAGGGR